MDAGTRDIAHAYLLHDHDVDLVLHFPPGTTDAKRRILLDFELLQKLGRHFINSNDTNNYAFHVLNIMLGRAMRSHAEKGQSFIRASLVSFDYLLEKFESKPQLGGHCDISGGCLTTKSLLYDRNLSLLGDG